MSPMDVFNQAQQSSASNTPPQQASNSGNLSTAQGNQQTTAPQFPSTVTPNNRPQINPNGYTSHDSGGNNDGNDNDVATILRNMTAGGEIGTQPFIPPQQQYHQQQQLQNPQNASVVTNPASPPPLTGTTDEQQAQQAQQVVQQFLRFNPLPDPLEGLDVERVRQSLEQGDITGLTEAMSHTAQRASQSAMQSFLLMLPSMVERIEAKVLRSVSQQSTESQVWDRFVQTHKAFDDKSVRNIVEPQLRLAMKTNPNADRDLVFKAVASAYESLTRTMGVQAAQQPTTRNREEGSAFDIGRFLEQ